MASEEPNGPVTISLNNVADLQALLPAVNAVAVKLPALDRDDPGPWFRAAENQFSVGNVTKEDTKFHHVASQLSHADARRYRAVLRECHELALDRSARPYTVESASRKGSTAIDPTTGIRVVKVSRTVESLPRRKLMMGSI